MSAKSAARARSDRDQAAEPGFTPGVPEGKLIIQIDRPGERPQMKELRSLLEPLGVHVDPSYGPISINPKLGRFVVRGTASPAAVARVQSLPGVSVFRDAAVGRVRG